MVFGLGPIESKVGLAFTLTMVRYPYAEAWMATKKEFLDTCREYDWLDERAFWRAIDSFHQVIAFYQVLIDGDADNMVRKIQGYLRNNFEKTQSFGLTSDQLDEIIYRISMLMEVMGADKTELPSNLIPVNIFWDIYDCLTDRFHRAPNKMKIEVDFRNTTLGCRQFTFENTGFATKIAELYVVSLEDSTTAVNRLR